MKKRKLILAAIIVAFITAAVQADDRPKIYIRKLLPSGKMPASYATLISQSFENTMINMIKTKYDVMSHSTVKALMEQSAEEQALKCNDDSCVQTVIKTINAEYLVYGEIQRLPQNKYIISVKLMHRQPGGLAIMKGSTMQQINKVDFNEVKDVTREAVGELLGVTDEPKYDTAQNQNQYQGQYQQAQTNADATKGAAKWVTGNTIRGRFDSPTRSYQWYKVRKNNARNKTFTLNHPSGYDIDFAVLDGYRQVGSATKTSTPDSVNVGNVNSGILYVKVWNYRGAGNYTINLGKYDDPKSRAKTVRGTKIRGRFRSSTRTEHWYKLTGQQGTNPTFRINHSSGSDFDFAVFSGTRQVCSGAGTSSGDTKTCRVPGQCYVKVWNYRGSGSYTIDIMKQGNIVQSGNYGSSGNMDKSSAQYVRGMSFGGTFHSSSRSYKWYRLGGQEGVNPTFSIHHSSNADFDFEVYSNNNRVCTVQGTSSGDSRQCHVPGTCYIKVWNFRGSGNFTIRIQR